MPRYELRFNIPERQLGDSAPYKAFSRTVERLVRLRGHIADGARVEEVHVTGGSLFGSAMIATDTYQSALALVCRETPIIQLQWHLEEEVSPELTAELLADTTDLAESANGSSHSYSDSIVPEMDGNDLRQDWRQFFN